MQNIKIQKIINLVQEYARLYNFPFALEESIEDTFDKRFIIESFDKIKFITIGSKKTHLIAEHISLINNLLIALCLEPIISMKKNNELQEYLDYLNVDYENDNNTDEIICSYINNDIILGYTDTDKNQVITVIDLSNISSQMSELDDDLLDVYIKASSTEEILKASILLNDLRLSGIVCDMDCEDNEDKARNLIILEDEELKKGLIIVKDNLTGEETKVPEDEIIEYMLGVI